MTERLPQPGRSDHSEDRPPTLVVVPPVVVGGRVRRFAVRPGRLGVLAGLVFAMGFAFAAGLGALLWSRADTEATSARVTELEAELASVRTELADLARNRTTAPREEEPPALEATPTEKLALRLPTSEATPVIRVAILRSSDSVKLEGDGLIVVTGTDKAIPMPGGLAVVRRGPGGVFIEGVGTLPDGTPVENRLGSIEVDGKSFPGRLELHRDGKELLLVNELDLERYVQGVVAAELPAGFGTEAKKAQVVAARTYALMQRALSEGPFHVEATVADQVYAGAAGDGPTRAAVATTHGEVLSENGFLISAYFSSTCGGATEDPEHVWPDRRTRGVRSVSCGFCEGASTYRWSHELTPDRLATALASAGYEGVGEIQGLHIRERSASGRVSVLEVETSDAAVELSGQELRAAVGYMPIRSAAFDVAVKGEAFRFTGTGFGHGVGMCQTGAQGMDRKGFDYREILERYYPDAKVTKIY